MGRNRIAQVFNTDSSSGICASQPRSTPNESRIHSKVALTGCLVRNENPVYNVVVMSTVRPDSRFGCCCGSDLRPRRWRGLFSKVVRGSEEHSEATSGNNRLLDA